MKPQPLVGVFANPALDDGCDQLRRLRHIDAPFRVAWKIERTLGCDAKPVVGQPDQVFGEQPVAFVALRSGFDVVPGDLIEHCRQSLARYKVPREVYIEDVLPKNAVGKIAKPALRTRLQHT